MSLKIGVGSVYISVFVLSCLLGFLSNFRYSIGAALELSIFLSFSCFCVLTCFEQKINGYRFRSSYVIALFLLMLLWVITSSAAFNFSSALLQSLVYFAFLTPIFISFRFSKKELAIAVASMYFIVLIQLPFDFFFPNVQLKDYLDWYNGTFLMANNKSRFLGFCIPFLIFFLFKVGTKKIALKLLFFIAMVFGIFSFYFGFSNIAYLMIVAAVCLSIFKRFWVSFGFIAICFFSVSFLVNGVLSNLELSDLEKNLITYNSARYLDPGHGVVAVYMYGLEALKSQLFVLGTGLGEFSTRAAQLFATDLNQGIPKVMITYGYLSKTSSPYGLSSFFVWIVEGGIWGVFLLLLTLSRLKQFYSCFICRYLVNYLVLLLFYSPVMIEFSEMFIYFFVIKVANDCWMRINNSSRVENGINVVKGRAAYEAL